MAGIDLGGDSSVEWLVQVDHVRRNPDPESSQHPTNPKGWRQHGIDETDKTKLVNFKICIQIPDDRDGFFSDLQNAITDAANKKTLCFLLPIVEKQNKQISISWDSLP